MKKFIKNEKEFIEMSKSEYYEFVCNKNMTEFDTNLHYDIDEIEYNFEEISDVLILSEDSEEFIYKNHFRELYNNI